MLRTVDAAKSTLDEHAILYLNASYVAVLMGWFSMPLDDNSLATFFENKAAAFTEGDIELSAACFAVPSIIYVSDMVILLDKRDTVRDVLGAYHRNLVAQNYARTQLENFRQDHARNGTSRVSMIRREVDAAQRTIAKLESTYYCKRLADGRWNITMLEIHSGMDASLLAGLSLL